MAIACRVVLEGGSYYEVPKCKGEGGLGQCKVKPRSS